MLNIRLAYDVGVGILSARSSIICFYSVSFINYAINNKFCWLKQHKIRRSSY